MESDAGVGIMEGPIPTLKHGSFQLSPIGRGQKGMKESGSQASVRLSDLCSAPMLSSSPTGWQGSPSTSASSHMDRLTHQARGSSA